MLYIADSLKTLRKGKDLTQEEIAEMLGVSAQSVSKWERGETLPDITLLPALANLYKVSVDVLIGMDKINDDQTKNNLHATAYNLTRDGDYKAVISLYNDALKMYPNDAAFMSGLALVLALDSDPENVNRAITLCERALMENPSEKVRHSVRASLSFIYMKAGEKDKAIEAAKNLPHMRESREIIVAHIERKIATSDIDAYLRFIILGNYDEQDIVEIDFGISMIDICAEYNLLGKIESLREEVGAFRTKEGLRILPQIRIRDKVELAPNKLRVRCYADYLLDKEFADCGEAVNEVIESLRKIAQANIVNISQK